MVIVVVGLDAIRMRSQSLPSISLICIRGSEIHFPACENSSDPPSLLRAIQRSTAVPQAFRGLFGRDIALRLGHQLVADEELSHRCAAQQRWVEVDVEMAGFDLFGGAGEWRLVDSHA